MEDWVNMYDNEKQLKYVSKIHKEMGINHYDDKLDLGKLTNIDYQTDWIYRELQETNRLLKQQYELNHYLVRLIEHMLEKSDNLDEMRRSVRMEMGRMRGRIR